MRLPLSTMLIACVGLSTVPLAAQDSEWARVRRLPPGTEIVLTPRGHAPGVRYVVQTDESGLTVLGLADSSRLAAAADLLRGIAEKHPDYFSAARQGGTFLERNVRIGPDGVFVDGRKVADLGDIVVNIARTDVTEIARLQKGRGVWGRLGVLGGLFVGAIAGGFVAGAACQAAAGRDRCDTGAFLTGGLIGGLAGGGYGLQASSREEEDVIYRAP